MAFWAGHMRRAQELLPRIAPDLTNPQTHSKYASYAALDRVIRPVYTKEGFSLSFNTGESPLSEHLRVYCSVRHIGGHVEVFQIDMPNDGKGAKGGDVMTKTHATAAGASYGMRYLLKMVFNIAIGEEDRDGNSTALDEAMVVEPTGLDRLRETRWLSYSASSPEAYKMADQAKDKNAAGLFVRAKDKRKEKSCSRKAARVMRYVDCEQGGFEWFAARCRTEVTASRMCEPNGGAQEWQGICQAERLHALNY